MAVEEKELKTTKKTEAERAPVTPPNIPSPAEKKKREKEKKKDDKGKKKGGKAGIIFAVILLLIVGALVAVVLLNPLGLRDKYLNPLIRKIPVLNTIIDLPEEDGIPQGPTAAELSAQVAELSDELEQTKQQLSDSQKTADGYSEELASLRELEKQYDQFKALQEEFYNEAAFKDTKTTEKYLKGADPDLMKEIAAKVLTANQRTSEVKDYLNKISELDAKKAASALELIIPTDMELVVLILKAEEVDVSSAVLAEMSDENRAACLRQMRPQGF
ncbi:hypothetical protein FACS189490_13010 [Clostridia bacterium]|nr:hypothetical protein FACS189490_13010 [Clostridia bacterium]